MRNCIFRVILHGRSASAWYGETKVQVKDKKRDYALDNPKCQRLTSQFVKKPPPRPMAQPMTAPISKPNQGAASLVIVQARFLISRPMLSAPKLMPVPQNPAKAP